MSKETARAIIRFCDFMNGYHGKRIIEAIGCSILSIVGIMGFMLMFILLS